MSEIVIYHNPRCSKSRQSLALLEENGITPDIVPYLDTPPSEAGLRSLLKKLAKKPREIMRRGEAVYKEKNLADDALTDAQLVAAMVAHPILIERPIIVKGARAVLGRPPENVLELLD